MNLLNLGCGNTYHKDWLNIDFVSQNKMVKASNLLNGISLDSNTVVYHSHVLEHFSKLDGRQCIEEYYRVLKKDGIIRIAMLDYERIIKK
jgi:predicted SAM-dependent methyltransferase